MKTSSGAKKVLRHQLPDGRGHPKRLQISTRSSSTTSARALPARERAARLRAQLTGSNRIAVVSASVAANASSRSPSAATASRSAFRHFAPRADRERHAIPSRARTSRSRRRTRPPTPSLSTTGRSARGRGRSPGCGRRARAPRCRTRAGTAAAPASRGRSSSPSGTSSSSRPVLVPERPQLRAQPLDHLAQPGLVAPGAHVLRRRGTVRAQVAEDRLARVVVAAERPAEERLDRRHASPDASRPTYPAEGPAGAAPRNSPRARATRPLPSGQRSARRRPSLGPRHRLVGEHLLGGRPQLVAIDRRRYPGRTAAR